MKKKIIIFANTIWFLSKFKYDLISFLMIENDIECLYLRKGPSYDEQKINELKKKNVKFTKVNTKFILKEFILSSSLGKGKYNDAKELRNILVFTLGPILISALIFKKQLNKTIIILEGLGRVFSSRLIIYRFTKRIIQIIYGYIFSKCKYVLTLNYNDAAYLAEMQIAPISKVNTIPGTGVNINLLNDAKKRLSKSPKYIDFMARILPDKGFYDFVYMREYLLRHNNQVAHKLIFRVITPKSDIDKMSEKDIIFLKSRGIILKPYLSDPYQYYKDSRAIIVCTRYGEGLSRVVLESIYLGIPLLVSRNQGTEELLPLDYKYFTKSKNPSVLVAQLIRLLEDSDYIQKTFKVQRLIIKEFYSSEKSINVFKDFLS